jgi:hypothetical protein
VDPRIDSGLSGSPADSSNSEEGVSYLRRLRGNVPASASMEDAVNSAALQVHLAATPTLDGGERRQTRRFRCSGSVEFRVQGNDARMWGTLKDVSLHGCYVEMSATFAIGTKVDLILKSCGIRIDASGTIRATYPSLGMGIRFAEIETEQDLQLKQLLGLLAGRSAAPVVKQAVENDTMDAVASADASAFLDEIKQFFRDNRTLSREEFLRIAKRVRRSEFFLRRF